MTEEKQVFGEFSRILPIMQYLQKKSFKFCVSFAINH